MAHFPHQEIEPGEVVRDPRYGPHVPDLWPFMGAPRGMVPMAYNQMPPRPFPPGMHGPPPGIVPSSVGAMPNAGIMPRMVGSLPAYCDVPRREYPMSEQLPPHRPSEKGSRNRRSSAQASRHKASQLSAVDKMVISQKTLSNNKGLFGTVDIDGIPFPYLIRNHKTYLSVKMIEEKLLSKYPSLLPQELKERPPLISHYITEEEAALLNNINATHLHSEYGQEPFQAQRDLIVSVMDFEQFYAAVKRTFPQSTVDQLRSAGGRCLGGWLQVNNTVVPYVVRDQRQKMLPLCVIRYAAELLRDPSITGEEPTPLECIYLNEICSKAGLTFIFDASSALISETLLYAHAFPGLVVLELPPDDPFGSAQYQESSGSVPHSPAALSNPISPVESLPQISNGNQINHITEMVNNVAQRLNAQSRSPPTENASPSLPQLSPRTSATPSRTSTLSSPPPLIPISSPHEIHPIPSPSRSSQEPVTEVRSSPSQTPPTRSFDNSASRNQSPRQPPPLLRSPLARPNSATSVPSTTPPSTTQPSSSPSTPVSSSPAMTSPIASSPAGAPPTTSSVTSVARAQTSPSPQKASPEKPKGSSVVNRIHPVQYKGKTISCLLKQGKDHALIEALGRVYFPKCPLQRFVHALDRTLKADLQQLTDQEEAAFIQFYGLPTTRLKCNKIILLESFDQYVPELQRMFAPKPVAPAEDSNNNKGVKRPCSPGKDAAKKTP